MITICVDDRVLKSTLLPLKFTNPTSHWMYHPTDLHPHCTFNLDCVLLRIRLVSCYGAVSHQPTRRRHRGASSAAPSTAQLLPASNSDRGVGRHNSLQDTVLRIVNEKIQQMVCEYMTVTLHRALPTNSEQV
uniref:Proline-rich membrane anchor 1 n=1 Tax=Lygus hesperus TaxID=30085 RepID=A0A0A9X7Q5_LYGHE